MSPRFAATRRADDANAEDLFSPYALGSLTFGSRMVMAPMTRSRAIDGNIPNPLSAQYYAQRASAGLIITEGTQISPQGVGYIATPGMHAAEQVAGWKKVTAAVHAAGGKIFAQLWHVGRISHPDFHGGGLPVGPSALPVDGEAYTMNGRVKIGVPRALETHEIPEIAAQFREAAKNAKSAGFDGVELHGANGYLLDQFLRDGSNRRSDRYGGSLANRARFPLEVAEAVLDVWDADRVGYRVSPAFSGHSMSDSNPAETFGYLARQLSELGLGYLHVSEPIAQATARLTPALREAFAGTLIVNGGYDADSGNEAIANGEADLVAFGVPFLANPDLPVRFRKNAPLNTADPESFYGGGEKGYIDYPALDQAHAVNAA